QPACLSLLLLGLSFGYLWRPHAASSENLPPARLSVRCRQYMPLLLLFALWANLDDWFFLGPALAGLFWLGERLERPVSPGGRVALAGLGSFRLAGRLASGGDPFLRRRGRSHYGSQSPGRGGDERDRRGGKSEKTSAASGFPNRASRVGTNPIGPGLARVVAG